ncbi:phage baseplate assembly protein V [Acetobacteraceae bacterium KSS8]|uniref:Phage baseplate assembly protein V n=1 Tax=Endosaccharibacter trunci TaxID=2812733 RepID=A0ABT1W4X1_9PROT|nr:phage baseplate assembly protein V [Acetobacteraceae bacterium KSS8]
MTDWMQTVRLHAAIQSAALGQARHGVVTSVDPSAHAVRVTIQPEGLETGWIPDGAVAAGGLKIVCPSEIGTQVLVVPVEGDAEHPVVVSRLFDATVLPPRSPFTNALVQPGEFALFAKDGTCLHFAQGNLYLQGNLHIQGSVQASGDVVGGGVSLQRHTHGGVQSGQAFTTAPQAANG